MPDIWVYKDKLMLCHNKCKITVLLKAGAQPKTWVSFLQMLKTWLDTHPKEIVTLDLENYANAERTYKDIQSVPGLEKYILTPSDYDPIKHGGKWPTLQWLQNRNKRLIIFDAKYGTPYAFHTNTYLIRNMYGNLYNLDKVCTLRGAKEPNWELRTLYQLNYYGKITDFRPKFNTPERLKEVLAKCQENGVIPKGKTPNIVSIDYVDRGNPMKWVNELNKQAARRLKR